jgi:transcriptional regulator with XRE-family HTH domain
MMHVISSLSADSLRRLRNERLLSQRELAAKAGLSPTTILKLEAGRVKESHPRTVRKLANALSVDPKELIKESGDTD